MRLNDYKVYYYYKGLTVGGADKQFKILNRHLLRCSPFKCPQLQTNANGKVNSALKRSTKIGSFGV